MKKNVFTLLTVFVLAIMAGGAYAQIVPGQNNAPYPGGNYNYTVTGIWVNTEGTINVQYLTGAGATISAISPATIPANAATDLTFNVAYDEAATDGKLRVTITDGAGCTNFIELAIDVQPLPTLDIAVVASNFTCSNLNATPSDNIDATVGAAQNSFTYTITPTVTNLASGYNYDLDFDIAPTTSGLTSFAVSRTIGNGTLTGSYAAGYSIVGATTATQVFTVTFNTTEGLAPVSYVGTISNPVLNVTAGASVYDGTVTANDASVTVKTTPTIGSFTIQ